MLLDPAYDHRQHSEAERLGAGISEDISRIKFWL
jgi:hypothetical protein